jgi:hypothetical protein
MLWLRAYLKLDRTTENSVSARQVVGEQSGFLINTLYTRLIWG